GHPDGLVVRVHRLAPPLAGQPPEAPRHELAPPATRTPAPNAPPPPMVTSGLRIGTPALATRGFGDAEFTEVSDIIATALAAGSSDSGVDVPLLRQRVTRLAREFPLYEGLEDWSLAGG